MASKRLSRQLLGGFADLHAFQKDLEVVSGVIKEFWGLQRGVHRGVKAFQYMLGGFGVVLRVYTGRSLVICCGVSEGLLGVLKSYSGFRRSLSEVQWM